MHKLSTTRGFITVPVVIASFFVLTILSAAVTYFPNHTEDEPEPIITVETNVSQVDALEQQTQDIITDRPVSTNVVAQPQYNDNDTTLIKLEAELARLLKEQEDEDRKRKQALDDLDDYLNSPTYGYEPAYRSSTYLSTNETQDNLLTTDSYDYTSSRLDDDYFSSFGSRSWTGDDDSSPADSLLGYDKKITPLVDGTCNEIGNTTYCDDGSYQQIGNTLYGPDGSYQAIGNTIYGPDGSTSQKIGNTTYTNDGSYQQIGNTTYGSDGSTYTRIGNTTYGSSGY